MAFFGTKHSERYTTRLIQKIDVGFIVFAVLLFSSASYTQEYNFGIAPPKYNNHEMSIKQLEDSVQLEKARAILERDLCLKALQNNH
jgi:hypothetical protein